MFDPGKVKSALLDVSVPTPTGHFVPFKRAGKMIYLSGQTCSHHDRMQYQGAIGSSVSIEQGKVASRVCMLNLLAALDVAVSGDWSDVQMCVSIKAYVQATPNMTDLDSIVDGALDLLKELGVQEPTWTLQTLGSSALPGDASVEIEAVFVTHSDS